ncbi:hypothetical protein ACE6H2_020694 [Prunus campanulata]
MELQFMNCFFLSSSWCLCWAVQNECFFKWPQHPVLWFPMSYVWLLVLIFLPMGGFYESSFF